MPERVESITTSTMSVEQSATSCSLKCSAISLLATTSKKKSFRGVGNSSPNAGVLTGTACGSPFTNQMMKPKPCGMRGSVCRWIAFSVSVTKTTFGRWAIPGRADHVARFTSTEVRHLAPMVARCMTLPVTGSWSFGTSSSCSSISRPTGHEFCCRSHRLTPVQASREFLRYCKVSTRCGKPISCSRCSTRHVR